MVCKISIVGVGIRRAGTSKTGNPYAFTPIHYTREDKNVRGLSAENCNVSDDVMNSAPDLQPGMKYEVYMHYANFRPVIDAIVGEA